MTPSNVLAFEISFIKFILSEDYNPPPGKICLIHITQMEGLLNSRGYSLRRVQNYSEIELVISRLDFRRNRDYYIMSKKEVVMYNDGIGAITVSNPESIISDNAFVVWVRY